MKKSVLFLFVFLVVIMFGFTKGALAATKTNNLVVTASVEAACTITSVGDINFGAYDPTSSSPLDADGNMKFRCVKGTTYKTYIVGTRSMTNGTDTLSFALYTDSNRTTVFPSDNSGSGAQASSNQEITVPIYGRVAAQQDVSVGNYSRTLTATVEY